MQQFDGHLLFIGLVDPPGQINGTHATRTEFLLQGITTTYRAINHVFYLKELTPQTISTLSHHILLWVVSRGYLCVLMGRRGNIYMTNDNVLIFGGYGVRMDYPMQRLYRAVRAPRLYEGTTEIQKLIVCREMLKKYKQ